ncbi:hypothetical protein CHU98_g8069 [Xylaria longipes]|nr:hypothetical protein CHU98_g8069 [Xylaria longipes]
MSLTSMAAGGNRTSLRLLPNPHGITAPEPGPYLQRLGSLDLCSKVLIEKLYQEDLIVEDHLVALKFLITGRIVRTAGTRNLLAERLLNRSFTKDSDVDTEAKQVEHGPVLGGE